MSRDLAEQVAELARLRNILAHQYLDIRWNSLKDFINAAPLVLTGFISGVERLVQPYLNDQPPQRAQAPSAFCRSQLSATFLSLTAGISILR